MRALRVLLGAALVPAALAALWVAGILDPPEGVRRRVAAFAAVYPGPVAKAAVEGLPCPPLARVRFYVVCTAECEEIWRIVAVKGLGVETVSDLNRVPRERRGETRRRFNRLVAGEALRLDAAQARAMAGCVLRLDGTRTEFLVEEMDVGAIEAARDDEASLRRLAESLSKTDGLPRLTIDENAQGFEARAFYLNTDREGWPVLELRLGIARDGEILWVTRRVMVPGGSAPPETAAETPQE